MVKGAFFLQAHFVGGNLKTKQFLKQVIHQTHRKSFYYTGCLEYKYLEFKLHCCYQCNISFAMIESKTFDKLLVNQISTKLIIVFSFVKFTFEKPHSYGVH